ncbi:site-specific integrase [Legionella sp. km535]|uniref:tyrosine-type recombinase/integrase n=1 Tax=Legionella sp. km535 TaxID=2498107 RepID=UPI000F8D851D|nr:site-specific integrase [Legionella sp. km535]RUR20678.1 site-specific integrase [Legionella sp. km535]
MKFTDVYIRNLKPQQKWFEQIEFSGLGIRVMPGGGKSWIFRFTFDGKRYKMTLGKYPGIGLREARELMLDAEHLKEQGINPIEHAKQQQAKSDNTVKKLALSWYTHYVEKHLKRPLTVKKQIDGDITMLLGDWVLDELETKHITQALDKIVKRGASVHANRVLSSLKQMFGYAVSRGTMSTNPASNIRARDIGGHEKPRERVLSLEEIKTLWLFLDSNDSQMAPQTRIAIKIILLTGVRTAELRLAQWDEINFAESLWTIPAIHSKASILHKVHLSNLTINLLQQLKLISKSNYVLTGIDGRQPLTENALPRAIKRIQDRLGIPEWTAHDLRRTFATQLGEALQIDPVVIEKCLGHKMPRIMATYNRNEMLPQRKEALDSWANYVYSLLQDKVIHLPFAKSM